MRSPPAVGWSDMMQANPKNEHWFRRDPQKIGILTSTWQSVAEITDSRTPPIGEKNPRLPD